MTVSVEQSRPAKVGTRPLRVAVADDCLESRMLLRATLESAGFEVVGEAIDGLGAVELACERRPDVVLLDYMMPVLSGLEAIGSIREGSPRSKVIVLSAMIQDQVHDHLAQTAPDAWLVKGSHPEQVANVVARVAGRGDESVAAPADDVPTKAQSAESDIEPPAHSLAAACTPAVPAHDDTLEPGAVGIALLTTTGRFIRVNTAFEKLCGRRVASLTGTWAETLERNDAERAASAIGLLVEGELDRYEARVHFDRPDGCRREADVRLSVLRNGAGLPFKLLVQVRDLDARGEAHAAALTTVATRDTTDVAAPNITPDPPPRAPAPSQVQTVAAWVAERSPRQRADRRQDLRTAVLGGEIVVHYQPVVELGTGRILATEALVRWDHPEAGLLFPRDFLSLAEEIGVLGPIGRTVIETACRQAQEWRQAHPQLDLAVSVNLSVPELTDARLCEFVEASLRDAKLPADRLWVEVTEKALAEAGPSAVSALARLDGIGVRTLVDDLSGAPSARIQALPVHGIKIDRSFLNGLGGTDMAEAVVRSIVQVASARQAITIAKGVDGEDQTVMASRLGCTAGQGEFFGRPAEPEAVARLLARVDADLAAR